MVSFFKKIDKLLEPLRKEYHYNLFFDDNYLYLTEHNDTKLVLISMYEIKSNDASYIIEIAKKAVIAYQKGEKDGWETELL